MSFQIRLSAAVACLICTAVAAVPAVAQVIDFETLPGGTPTTDQQVIDTQFAPFGVTFSLLDRTTGLPIGAPRIAKTGLPLTAFEGCIAADTPLSHLDFGRSFLTDGTTLGVQGDLRIEYAAPVQFASGVILDVDCRIDGGAPCEQWTITAFDGSGAVIQVVVLDAPAGAPNVDCQSPGAGPGDSDAMGWSLGGFGVQINSIVIRYTGVAVDVGLAFDMFSVAGTPTAVDPVVTASADTICAGEEVQLTVSVSGGYPPYSFQWQAEVGPSVWSDLGTAATQPVQPTVDTRYRVMVADASAAETTSDPVTVHVATDHPLCAASLLVSCNTGDNVVRYGFLSRQAVNFVASGSGGLNGASHLDCGPDGNLYVSSQNADAVLRFDGSTGASLGTFVPGGSGGLNIPVGLGFGPDGNLYVVSNATNEVLRYDGATGAFMGAFVPAGNGLNSPTGLTFGPDADLFVCSRNGDKVLRFDGATGAPLGDFVTAGSGGLDAPRGLTFGPDGQLYVAEEVNDSVRRFDGTSGAFLDVFVAAGSGGLDRANDVAFGPDGRLYVASFNSDQVLVFDGVTGTPASALTDGLFQGPSWLVVGCRSAATAAGGLPVTRLDLLVEPSVPNPFNPRTNVAFSLTAPGRVRVSIVDLTGREVATLLDSDLGTGRHVVSWNGELAGGRAAPAGVYLVRVAAGRSVSATKIALVR
ncbi:MAG: T9SS type A sorting domain-containing protein [bacterium]|nr:T9SS type A sorting domain-containing protein [bacterium]